MTDYEQMREKYFELPPAVDAVFRMEEPSEPLPLFDGAFTVERQGSEASGEGSFTFKWLPSPRVHLDGKIPSPVDSPLANLGECTIKIPAKSTEGELLLTHLRYGWGGEAGSGCPVEGIVKGSLWAGQSTPADSVVFHVPNFIQYHGSKIRLPEEDPDELSSWAGRLTLETDDLRILLDELPGYKDRKQSLKRDGGFQFTHVGRIEPKDGGTVTQDTVSSLSGALHNFMSFCRGRWCRPTLLVGQKDGSEVWTEWGSPHVSPWEDGTSWFPTNEPAEKVGIPGVFETFSSRWNDPLWKEAFTQAVTWYVEANENAGLLEGSIALTQTALELLAWVYIVEDQELFSQDDFRDQFRTASEKFRLLLYGLGIPRQIPDDQHLENVYGLLKDDGYDVQDGPDLLASVRNMVVHPRKAKRARLARLGTMEKHKVKQLGLLYVELCLLRLLDYDGPYYSRLHGGSVANRKRMTPWT